MHGDGYVLTGPATSVASGVSPVCTTDHNAPRRYSAVLPDLYCAFVFGAKVGAKIDCAAIAKQCKWYGF